MSENPLNKDSVKLLPLLLEAFSMKQEDINLIEADILKQAKSAWLDAISLEASLWGCPSAVPNSPRLGDLDFINNLAETDAISIANTFNVDLERRLIQLYNARPRGNRYYYLEELEIWSAARYVWKSKQIAINTEQEVQWYGRDRFRQMNGLRGGLYFYGGNPRFVSETCQRRNRATLEGKTNEEYIQKEQYRPHGNCPHLWLPLNPTQQDCTKIWVG